MIIYIACKIAEDKNYAERFADAAEKLTARGFTVLSPTMVPEQKRKGVDEISNRDKPCICEVLGVDIGEEFEVPIWDGGPFRINKKGVLVTDEGYICVVLTDIINHPNNILREQTFTSDDIALIRRIAVVFGPGGIIRSKGSRLWFTSDRYEYELPENTMLGIKCGDDIEGLNKVQGENK